MVFRFFWFIWAAIAMTIVAVLLIVIFADLEPPGEERSKILRPFALSVARDVYLEGGETAVQDFFQKHAVFRAEFSIKQIALTSGECGQDRLISMVDDKTCLVLKTPIRAWYQIYIPGLLPLLSGLAISIIMAIFLARYLARPIRVVKTGLLGLAEGKLDHRIDDDLKSSGNEFIHLGQAFDTAATHLQTLSDSRSRLFHDISHEIRSPLARLQAAMGLLHQNPARLDAMLERMQTDIERINRLLGEILTLARIEHNSSEPLDRHRTDLVDLLYPILEDARFEGRDRGITLTYSGPKTLPLDVEAELMHRAFENIIRNAIRFSPDQAEIQITGDNSGALIKINVADQGKGVPEDRLSKLFDPYVRGTSSGVGLGLAISQRAAQLHGGQISAQNRDGGGLSVTISLPVNPTT